MLWARVHGQARHTGPQVYWTCLADLTKTTVCLSGHPRLCLAMANCT